MGRPPRARSAPCEVISTAHTTMLGAMAAIGGGQSLPCSCKAQHTQLVCHLSDFTLGWSFAIVARVLCYCWDCSSPQARCTPAQVSLCSHEGGGWQGGGVRGATIAGTCS